MMFFKLQHLQHYLLMGVPASINLFVINFIYVAGSLAANDAACDHR